VFRDILDRCDAIVRELRQTSLLERMFDERPAESELASTLWVQPAVFAFEVALAELLISRGVRPMALVGHSVGEIAAAVTASVMSVEDGMRLVCARSSLMAALPAGGAMLALGASEAPVQALLDEAGLASCVEIAALNAPTQTVCSADDGAIARLEEWARTRGIRAKRLDVSHAFHSRAMDPMLDAMESIVAGLTLAPPSIPLFSNVTGALVQDEMLKPGYWRKHVRQPVRFSEQIASLRQLDVPCDVFVEVGPLPVLLQPVAECLGDTRVPLLACSRGRAREIDELAETLAALFVHGVKLTRVDDREPVAPVSLPTYPFQRERFWIDADPPRPSSSTQSERDELLGRRLQVAGIDAVFELDLSGSAADWIEEHRVQGHAILPAAFYLAAAQHLAELVAPGDEIEVRALTVDAPLLRAQTEVLQVVVQAARDGEWDASFSSRSTSSSAGFREHARVRLARAAFTPPGGLSPVVGSERAATGEEIYRMFSERGLAYGPSFRKLTELRSSGGISLGTLSVDDVSGPALVALLDCALQATAGTFRQSDLAGAWVPVGVQRCRIASLVPGEPLTVHARMRPGSRSSASRVADVFLFDRKGKPVGLIEGVGLQALTPGALEQWLDTRHTTAAAEAYRTEWRTAPELDVDSLSGRWILAGGPRDVSMALAAEIRRLGGEVSHIAEEDLETRNDVRGIVCLHALDVPTTLTTHDALASVLKPTAELVQSVLERGRSIGRLWLVTAGAHSGHDERAALQAALWGLGNALTWEHPELLCTRADIERGAADRMAAQLVSLLAARSHENQFRVSGQQTLVPRLVRHTAGAAGVAHELAVPSSPNYHLVPSKSGRIDDIALRASERVEPGPGEVELRVHASGLNFRDVLVALSVYPGNVPVLGGECCGIVTRVGQGVANALVGTRVLALTAGAFCRYATVPAASVIPVPACLSDEKAAGFPIVFLTAWYALREVARLKRGERVLIHAAAGGVGQAAIQIARALGAEIWVTASKPKRDGLRAHGIEHVFDSRDVNAVRAIRERAGARGVDVVLNCLAGEFIDASLELLNEGGRFIELGKADLRDASDVARRYPGVSYTAFDLAVLAPEILRRGVEEVFGELERGQLAPVAVTPFPLEQAVDVFRRMAQGAHTGKIAFVHPAARDELLVRPDRSYVVTGGLGAIGRVVAERLVREGAGEIVLISRRAPGAETAELVVSLSNERTRVSYRQADVANLAELEHALSAREGSLPIGGVFHAAGVLDDGVFAALSWDRFERVLAPKVQGTLHVLSATRHHPVDFVVLFSSAAAVVGGAGQANYAVANAFMAALAQRGTTTTPRVLSVDWGPWAEGGMAERAEAAVGERWTRLGVRRLAPRAAVDLLWNALRGSAPRLCALDVDFATLTSRLGYVPPLLRELVSTPTRVEKADVKRPSWLSNLASVPEADRPAVLQPWLEGVIREVMGGKVSGTLSARQPLRDLGMDSLMAVELRNHIATTTNLSLPMSALFEHPSLDDLCRYIARQWALEGGVTAASSPRVQPTGEAAEPIAIVGAACRFPGRVGTLEDLWQLLETAGDAIEEVPASRWSLDQWYDPDPEAPGKMYTRWMGALENVDQFDAGFFGISPHEATSLDPQQRLLLELSWQALEHAGIPPRALAGSPTGVFIGISTHDYGARHVFGRGARHVDAFSGIGNALSAAAGRLSYVLGLEGPSLAVDTACSSSLVALHLASRSLRAGESNLALVGGVNLILAPETTVYFCRLGAMARNGRCKVFDDAADGYVRSDGCAVVVLKRLSDAMRDGDRILGVVRGTAVNQDGRSNGLTAPNGAAQQAVIRAALADARLRADEIGYLEAHGTGTALGDAVELDALRAVFVDGTREHDLAVGSIKSNMGHLEAAAGMAGLLKAVLAVDRGQIPANVHLQSTNHNVSWDGMTAPQTLVAWPAEDRSRRAGVSSFGFTGTNAHAIVEQAPPSERDAQQCEQPTLLLMPVSARSPRALQTAATQMADRLERATSDEVGALCWNAGARRSHLEYRMAVHGRDAEALVVGLREQAAVLKRAALPEARPMFVFSGQGGQWHGMGRGLLRRVPVFANTLREVDTALGRWLDWSVCDLLLKEEGGFGASTPDVLQPLLFAMQVGLAALWQHMGVRPTAVVGHSMGEVAAAFTAGALSLDDAAKIIVLRSRLAARLSGSGGMLLVSARGEQIEEILSKLPRGVCVAARNSYASVVLSGDQAQVVELRGRLREAGTFTELVDVDFAAHSHHVDPVLDELGAALTGLVLSPPSIPMRSTVTLEYMTGGEGPAYWQANLRNPVQLHAAMQSEVALGRNLVIEISPHPVLLQSIEQDLERAGKLDEVRVLGSMSRTRDDDALEFWRALTEAYAAGAELDWNRLSGRRFPVLDLPSTAFERRSFWIDAAPSEGSTETKRGLPGTRLESAGSEILFDGELSSGIGDLAATALGALVAVGLELSPHTECSFDELRVSSSIDGFQVGSRAQTIVREDPDGLSIALFVKAGSAWEKVADGRLATRAFADAAAVDDAAMSRSTGVPAARFPARWGEECWDAARLRRACVNRGISLECVAKVSAAEIGEGFARFELRLTEGDDCVALACALARVVLAGPAWSAPAAVEGLAVRGRPRSGSARLTVRSGPTDSLRLELDCADSSWAIRFREIVFRAASAAPGAALVGDLVATLGTELHWRPATAPRLGPGRDSAVWLVQYDGSDLARSIVERLAGCGRSATLVPAHASPEEWRSHAEAARSGDARASVVFTAPLHAASNVGSASFAAALVQSFVTLDDAGVLAVRGFHCLTRGAHAAIPLPEQAGLWGLGRV
ncbi:MAG TPA: SDR family NAD(P)-dependent oxidoreductase, partial [Vicinamibacterales bacterium]